MKIDELLDAFGEIDPVYIEEAEKMRFARRRRVKYWVPAACAALLLTLGGGAGLWKLNDHTADTTAEATAEAADTAVEAVMESAASQTGVEDLETYEAAEAYDDAAAAEAAEAYEAAETREAVGVYDETAVCEDVTESDTEESNSGAAREESAAAEDVWKMNEVEELQTVVACGGVIPSDVAHYKAKELEAYYGISILPASLPEGYSLEETETYAVSYAADGTVLEDNCTLIYSDSKTGGELLISARTVDLGEMTSFVDEGLAVSVIGTTKVTVGHYLVGRGGGEVTDGYLAIYEKDGVKVTVKGTAVTEEVFRRVLESLLRS